MSDKNAYYKSAWEDPNQYPNVAIWIKRGKDDQHFACKICSSGSLKLSNMGISAVRSHMKPSKAGEPKTKHEKAYDLWFKMKKLEFKPNISENLVLSN